MAGDRLTAATQAAAAAKSVASTSGGKAGAAGVERKWRRGRVARLFGKQRVGSASISTSAAGGSSGSDTAVPSPAAASG